MSPLFDIWLFRRDLRLDGHMGLEACQKLTNELLPIFIFDPRQIEDHPYRSRFGLNFLISALKRLDAELKRKGSRLHVFYGLAEEVIEEILRDRKVRRIHTSRDVTPFARQRDEDCRRSAETHGTEFVLHDTLLLQPPGSVHKDDGKPYTVFTPFYKKALSLPSRTVNAESYKGSWLSVDEFSTLDRMISIQPSLENVQTLMVPSLNKMEDFDSVAYCQERDMPSLNGTTGLSAHLKFGTLSPHLLRDVFERSGGADHPVLRQLFWRDFFHHIAYHFPRVFGNSFQKWTEKVVWPGSDENFALWCEGETGFPIVDAGMRELVSTGRMHNRVRMVVASFLTKDLEVDWKKGEKFFSNHLEDYDPCLNNGNWQWAASTGCDAQPYFRIFNPWLQQKRFDPDGLYIKKWVPELKDLNPTDLHNGFKKPISPFYPPPLVDHGEASLRSKSRFADAKDN